MIYVAESESRTLNLAASSGIEPGHPAAPECTADDSVWPFEEALQKPDIHIVSHLGRVAATGLPGGPWSKPPAQVAMIPILPTGEIGRSGVLVAGLNPFRKLDDRYRGFLGLVAGQIAAAIDNAQAYEDERKRAEALAELDRTKTAFFANISHEFRTPLTLLLGPLEEALAKSERLPSDNARELLGTAHRNALRLLKLVNTLLDFARIEAGRVQAVFEPTDLARFTAELASGFRSAMEKARIRFTVDCDAFDEFVHVDREMWEKIVLNLLSNALKFTFAGEVTVTLRATNDSHAELTVSDTGVGIPRHELQRVFERFHRVEGQRGRSFEGSGIGLALVQELVRIHGGSIQLESEVGRGAKFIVRIPLGSAHLPAERIGAPRTLTGTSIRSEAYIEEAMGWLPEAGGVSRTTFDPDVLLGPLALGSKTAKDRVLLVDDNADLRNYVGRLLRDQGYDVDLAADGTAAIETATKQTPDLIVSDVMMPRLDGFGLLQAVRSKPELSHMPVI
jgi:signal transduction histidine kinase